MTILVTILLTLIVEFLIETIILKIWLHKAKNQTWDTWEEFVESSRKDGLIFRISNDDKGNDVDRFFNGEVIHADFISKIDDPDAESPGEVQIQFVKDY